MQTRHKRILAVLLPALMFLTLAVGRAAALTFGAVRAVRCRAFLSNSQVTLVLSYALYATAAGPKKTHARPQAQCSPRRAPMTKVTTPPRAAKIPRHLCSRQYSSIARSNAL